MAVVVLVLWVVLLALWLLSAPGFLVAFTALGDPPPGFLPGWGVAFLGWLSVPVTSVIALVALSDGDASPVTTWLPAFSLAALPLGYVIALAGIGLATLFGRGRPQPPAPEPPPAPTPERRAASRAAAAARLERLPAPPDVNRARFEALDDGSRRRVQLDLAERLVLLWSVAVPDDGPPDGIPQSFPLEAYDDAHAGRDVHDLHPGLAAVEEAATTLAAPFRDLVLALVLLVRLRAVPRRGRAAAPDDERHWTMVRHAYAALGR